jgi:PAS domain S-box-containing protein
MDVQPERLETTSVEVVLDSLLRTHPNALIAAINADGLFVPMPDSVALTGHRAIPGRSALDVVIPEDREAVIATWEQARSHGAARVDVHLSGDPREAAVIHYLDVQSSHGVFLGLLIGAADGGGALAQLQTSALPPRIARVRKSELAVYLAVDEATTRILGWKPEEMVARRSLEFVHPDDQERAIQSWMLLLELPNAVVPVRLRHRRADGGWTWFEVANRNLLADPEFRCVLADMIDITDEMAAQEALRVREQLLRVLAEALPIGVCEVALDRQVVYANERLRRMLGAGPADTVDELLSGVSPLDRPLIDEMLEAALADGVDGDLEVQVAADEDGGWLRCLIRVRPLVDEHGAASGAVVSVEDVTAARAADEELRRLAAAVEHSADTVVISDLEGRVVYVNPAFERAVGYRRDELVGQPPEVTARVFGMSPADPTLWTSLEAGRAWSGTLRNHRKDGTAVEFDVLVTLVRDGRGVPIGSVGVGRDLTRERALEAQVRHAQKMEAVGQLAGGIAHDFNNLLTVIRGYAELHLAGHPSDDAARADVLEIERAADRAARLTHQLLAFSRRQLVQPEPLDLAAVVAAAVPLLAPLLGERVQLRVRVHSKPLMVLADRGQLEQVLLTLAGNARDAMPDGGSFSLETSLVSLDDDFVTAHPGAIAGPHAMLVFSDTGTGIDVETQGHLFEPFFTTKEQGKGTGLGLASAYGIVQQAGGYIGVESEPGQGTTFRIYLPCLPSKASVASPSGEAPAGEGPGRATILLVEDEPGVRAVAVRELERHGYEVLPFGDPREALAYASSNAQAFDAVLTDVVMPGMNGPAMVDRLLEHRPDLPVLYMSGYDPDCLDAGRRPLLVKPFSGDGLASAVRDLLVRGRDGS